MSEPLSAEELERVRAGGSTPRLVATIDFLTAERDHYVKSWKNRLEALAAAEAQMERLTKALQACSLFGCDECSNATCLDNWPTKPNQWCQTCIALAALASEGSSDGTA